jgi:hypothetical protein
MIAERFAVEHLRTAERQRVWMVQTREGTGLVHFYGKHSARIASAGARPVPGLRGGSCVLRRIGRQFDVSQVLIGEGTVFDFVNATSEMVSRFDLLAVPRWHYGDEFLTLLDSLEGALPLARCSDLFDEKLARKIFQLSEGLIGEIIAIVTTAAAAAARCGTERITMAGLDQLRYIRCRCAVGRYHDRYTSFRALV